MADRMLKKNLHIVCIITASLLLLLPGAGTKAQSTSLIKVLQADSLRGSNVNNVLYRELIGHVRINQDRVYISCDHAMQNLTDNSVELYGNVVITQDTLVLKTARGAYNGNTKVAASAQNSSVYLHDGHVTLTADGGLYDTGKKLAHFLSHVHVKDSISDIRSDTLLYVRDSSKAVVTGNVQMEYRKENAIVTGDSAIHYVKKKITFFTKSPILWQIDTNIVRKDSLTGKADSIRLDTLSIKSRRMEAYRDSTNYFRVIGDVEIVRKDLSARCGVAQYYRNDSLFILQHEPVLWYDLNQVTGDSIDIFLANDKLDKMIVTGNAYSTSQSKAAEKDTVFPIGRYDQIKGKKLTVVFVNNKASKGRVEQTAISLYYVYDDHALNGVRKESGDLILFDFKEGKLDRIHTIGGVEGTYYPEKYVTGKEATYNLEGFNWRADKPVQPKAPPRLH